MLTKRPRFTEPLHVGSPHVVDRTRYFDLMHSMLDRNWLTNDGPLVREFEAMLAKRIGARNVVAMVNGTVALEIAIRALGLSGEVIVPSYTFIATAHAVHWQGLRPLFADIDPTSHHITAATIEPLISTECTGIIATHLWGLPVDIDGITALARRRGLNLIFDAAHAFGVYYQGTPIGNFGDCEVFSFHATKCLNSLEGGAIATNDDDLAQRTRLMRNFGFAGHDNVVHPGTNGKMCEACAAMGIANLEGFERIVAANRARHQRYKRGLDGVDGVSLLPPADHAQYVVIELASRSGRSRDDLLRVLHGENVLARRYFWPGCHRMAPYRDGCVEALIHTESVAERVLVLPNGGNISDDDVDGVCEIVREYFHA
jgi:dTDP-4-amino-4,6-dideoxygalactose transaminase